MKIIINFTFKTEMYISKFFLLFHSPELSSCPEVIGRPPGAVSHQRIIACWVEMLLCIKVKIYPSLRKSSFPICWEAWSSLNHFMQCFCQGPRGSDIGHRIQPFCQGHNGSDTSSQPSVTSEDIFSRKKPGLGRIARID